MVAGEQAAGAKSRGPVRDGAVAEGAAMPLCVDMDGTLVATDTLWESLLTLARRRPASLWRVPIWLLRGRAFLKARLAKVAPPAADALPYREEVVDYLREARAAGRPVVLATATDRAIATAVASHLGVFTEVLASDGEHNLKGAHKREILEHSFGRRGFEYVGDSVADRAVWSGAGRASCVGLSTARRDQVAHLAPLARVFEVPRQDLSTWLRALRVHQWVKNVLVFLPVLAAHRFTELPLVAFSLLAFLCLSLCASAVYVFNDLMDLPSDRAHPTKRHRPFASGHLSILHGLVAGPLLGGTALGISIALLPPLYTWALVAYLGLNVVYTVTLKRMAVADVVFLATVYSLRVIAGGFATGLTVSPWLIAFSLFFFLSLAFLKRYSDLRLLEKETPEGASPGRDYLEEDEGFLLSLGAAAGYAAAVVLALYIQSDKVLTLYGEPAVLWVLVPLLIYWISRIWLIAHRGRMTEDPIVFTTRDPVSYVVVAMTVGVFFLGALL